jgi:hypothetical protein
MPLGFSPGALLATAAAAQVTKYLAQAAALSLALSNDAAFKFFRNQPSASNWAPSRTAAAISFKS